MHVSTRLRSLQILCFALVIASAHAFAEVTASEVIRDTLPKVVKLYGAGGFKGLEAYGTGFLVSADGHIMTSWGPLLDADPVTVVLDDGRRFDGKLVRVDSTLGIAVLKIDPSGAELPHFDLSATSEASAGERFFALSNMFRVAAGDEPVSVMHGMIVAHVPLSARRGRFDAAIESPVYLLDSVTNNPGAAGGVIVSLNGQLLGMIGREVRGEESETWVNYAIPATDISQKATSLMQDLVDGAPSLAVAADPTLVRRPLEFGIVLIPDVTARTPAYITEIIPGSTAAAAGLKRDDLILFANDLPVRSVRELTQLISRVESGDEITLVVRRDSKLVTAQLLVP